MSDTGVRVTGLDHIVLMSADVERTVAFYRDVLGCGVERLEEWRRGEVFFPSVRLSAATLIDVFPGGRDGVGAAPERNLDHFCLTVETDDMAALSERLRAAGAAPEGEPVTRWGALGDGTSVYLRDPDGTQIELKLYPRRG